MATCNEQPDAVLKSKCRPLSESKIGFFSVTQPTGLKEPIEGMEVVGDVTDVDTWTDLLEAGDIRMYEISVTAKTSPAKRSGTIGVDTIPLGLEPALYTFHIKTNDEYLKAIKMMKSFNYMATMGADNFIQLAKDDNTSSDFRFLKIEHVTPLGADPMNDGSEVPMYLVEVQMSGNETFNKISRLAEFDHDILEQKKVADVGVDGSDISIGYKDSDQLSLVNANQDIFISDDDGALNDGVNLTVNGVISEGVYTVTAGILEITVSTPFLDTDVVVISVDSTETFFNDDYYGISLEVIGLYS